MAQCNSLQSCQTVGSTPTRTSTLSRGGEVETRQAHNLEIGGANPSPASKLGLEVFMDAHDTVTVEEGDRYPSGPPGIVSPKCYGSTSDSKPEGRGSTPWGEAKRY